MPVDALHLRHEIQRVYTEVVRDPKRGYARTNPDKPSQEVIRGENPLPRYIR